MVEEIRDLSIGQALDLGAEMAIRGAHASAIGLFKGVLVHEPANFEAIERLGSSLFDLKRYEEALYWFWRGRKINRRHPMALTNYGLTVAQLGHWDEALPDLGRAVYFSDESSPEVRALVYNNLGNTLEKLQRYPEALTALDKGIGFNANDPFPHYNRGIVLLRLNRHHEAIEALNRALALNHNDADARYNRGMGRLLLGDLKGGFEDYESRLLTSENTVPNLGLPAARKWTRGVPLQGRTILVHCEQGLGDDIQFFRFLPALVAKGAAQVLVMSHSATAPLLAVMQGVTVLTPGMTIPDYDYWVALMSLPLALEMDASNVPPPWAPIMGRASSVGWPYSRRPTPRVGVCWAGNWLHKNDAHRSIPLRTFSALFSAGVDFVSLQQLRPEDVEPFKDLLGHHSNLADVTANSLIDLANIIQSCNLIITVDTAVAHLAGSLDVPTWILIPKFSTDWRWQLERTDSPWYPSVRLIRQKTIGDWASIIDDVRAELTSAADTLKMRA